MINKTQRWPELLKALYDNSANAANANWELLFVFIGSLGWVVVTLTVVLQRGIRCCETYMHAKWLVTDKIKERFSLSWFSQSAC